MGKRIRNNRAKHNSKNNSSISYHSSLRKDEISKNFEENIRNILIMDYLLERDEFKKKICIQRNSFWISKIFIINIRIAYFQFNDDSWCYYFTKS